MGLSLSGVSSGGQATYGGMVRTDTALRAQLAQYRKQLSDCVNCASASTREGQQQIRQLTSRIAGLEAQVARADAPQAGRPSAGDYLPALAAVAAPGTGRLLDVYA